MMLRITILAAASLALGACNVSHDAANDATTLRVDANKVDAGLDEAGNALKGAAGEVRNAADQAAPVLENAARDVGNVADRAGQKLENGAERARAEVHDATRDPDRTAPANKQ